MHSAVISRCTFVIAALLFLVGSAPSQTLDRIVAVIDDEIILQSELAAQVEFFALNNRVDPATPGLRERVLESMISEKLIIAKAIEDSVTVTDEEVQQQMDAVLQQRIQQVGSEARLEELYGMPISRIRREFREEMRKNLIAQRLQQQQFGQVSVGRHEVEQFYETYKDSLPRVSEEVELAHIFMRPQVSQDARTTTRTKMQVLLDSINAGADFADIARRNSEDPGSAAEGGDLGLVRRGLFVKEFESAVFSLSEGEMSEIIETQFGLHVVQLLERRGDAVRARHILLRMERTQADDDSTIAQLERLRDRALAGEDFAELARKHSEDTETNLVGGQLGSFELDNLDKSLYDTVTPLTAGEISPVTKLPVGTAYGYHIVLVKTRIPAHNMTLEQDYRKLEALALNYKQVRDYEEWIDELKQDIYWKVYL
jgi:peptidyl-prolyl cis-trans isomerase SurA